MNCLVKFTIPFLVICMLALALPCSAEITKEQQIELNRINTAYLSAGKSYKAGDYQKAGEFIKDAQTRLTKLVEAGDMDVYRKASSMFAGIGKAHALLQLEGISLPSFKKPDPPQPKAMPEDKPAPDGAGNDELSFSKSIAPILVKNCGNCHVTGSRGDFSMATYETLMKGPDIGVVVVPGNPAGSRLIEIIDSGSMPPNGRGIPAPDLDKLARWVAAGAKYDGDAPNMQLTSFAGAGNGAAPRTPPPAIRASTGKETVSFAKDVASILVENCNGCHIEAMQTQGGLRMDTFAQLNRGGDTGPIVTAGNASMSLLIKRLKGEEGNRMPQGGRPPLSDKQIELISTWINEGATLDGSGPDQPLRVMTALAWARDATHEELMERRMEIASNNWKIGSPEDAPKVIETNNFYIVGSVGENTLKVVANQAEAALTESKAIVRRPAAPEGVFFKGRVSIFVFPRRYDYSEFGSMIEKRQLPQAWSEHWKYDGVDAYLAMVVTPADDDNQIRTRLIGPMTSLSVATLGNVPRWISEGVGRAAMAKHAGRENEAVRQWDEALPQALASLQKPDQLLKNQLQPDQADLISYGIGQFLLDRAYKPRFDKLVRNLSTGADFQLAFVQSFGGQPKDVIATFGKWYQMQNSRRRR